MDHTCVNLAPTTRKTCASIYDLGHSKTNTIFCQVQPSWKLDIHSSGHGFMATTLRRYLYDNMLMRVPQCFSRPCTEIRRGEACRRTAKIKKLHLLLGRMEHGLETDQPEGQRWGGMGGAERKGGERRAVQCSEVKWSEVKWSEVKWSETCMPAGSPCTYHSVPKIAWT